MSSKKTIIARYVMILAASEVAFYPLAQAAETEKACVTELQGFPVRDIGDLNTTTRKMGDLLPAEIGVSNDSLVISSVPSPAAFFGANLVAKFSTLNAADSKAFHASLPVKFLTDFGVEEMRLLGPDLSKADPFLDMSSQEAKSPSEEKVDSTNMTLGELTDRMTQLIKADQKSILENALRGNFSTSIDQIEAKIRLTLNKFTFTKEMFATFVSDKKFLQDMQVLLSGNLEQFHDDIDYIATIQGRYRKTRVALEKLSKEGEAILGMKDGILASITDEYTKQQTEKIFIRFAQRVTDITSGMAIADTFINMWEVIKDNHYELIAGINRALNYTIPIIGATIQLTNALARQERTRQTLRLADNTRNALINQLNEKMKANVAMQQTHELSTIEDDQTNLGNLLAGSLAVQVSMMEHNQKKEKALAAARENYKKISNDARDMRARFGIN